MEMNIEYLIMDIALKAEKGLRPSEIKKIINISEPTLHKYLKILVKKKYLIRKENKRANEYPHPVFYFFNKSNSDLHLLMDIPEEYRRGDINLNISKRYAELSIAKEIIAECGINAEAEIKKRYHKRYGIKKEVAKSNAIPETVSFEEFTTNDFKNKNSDLEFPPVSVKDLDDGED